jgi:transposase
MEATGVYWKPVWNILSDGDFELVLANAAHIKNVPGRKTDVSDAAWIADLLAHGLIRSSFVPEQQWQACHYCSNHKQSVMRTKPPRPHSFQDNAAPELRIMGACSSKRAKPR